MRRIPHRKLELLLLEQHVSGQPVSAALCVTYAMAISEICPVVDLNCSNADGRVYFVRHAIQAGTMPRSVYRGHEESTA
jgi:hypothetical protein